MLIANIYEDNTLGKLSDKRYTMLCTNTKASGNSCKVNYTVTKWNSYSIKMTINLLHIS